MASFRQNFLFVLGLLAIISNVNSYLSPIEPRNPLKGTPAPPGSIWPNPYLHSRSNEFYAVDTSNFEIHVVDEERSSSTDIVYCKSLEWVVDHYKQLIRSLKPANGSIDIGISSLIITIPFCPFDEAAYPVHDSIWDELSILKIEKRSSSLTPEASMEVNTEWGVARGLENFYQSLWPADDTYTVYNVNASEVIDAPRFLHRGILIDSARHFLPEETIIEILTVMMYNKFNVLHWHITDDQSFPYVSEKFPELSEKGKYHRNAVYSPETVQRIIEAARVRGIRVIFEFESPGHVGGLGMSHPELLTKCTLEGGLLENLDPSNEAVYDFMREFFTEFAVNVTKDKFVHLGMDEVYYPCWLTSPDILKFMVANGFTHWSQVQGYYAQRHVDMVKSLGLSPVSWQDPLDDGTELDPSVIVHVWKEQGWNETLVKALEKGHQVLFSSCWYLNLIGYGEIWRKYYECDPVYGAYVEKYRDQILGGEAAIWGEYVDQTNIVATLFPYASAVSSVLWELDRDYEDGHVLSTDDAMWRMDDFRCKLLRRGVRAQPMLNGYCGPFEDDLDL